MMAAIELFGLFRDGAQLYTRWPKHARSHSFAVVRFAFDLLFESGNRRRWIRPRALFGCTFCAVPSTARETVPAPLLVPALPTVLSFVWPPIAVHELLSPWLSFALLGTAFNHFDINHRYFTADLTFTSI